MQLGLYASTGYRGEWRVREKLHDYPWQVAEDAVELLPDLPLRASLTAIEANENGSE